MATRNAPTKLMEQQGYGKGYVYAHEAPEGVGGMDCLPESLQGTRYYVPRDCGFEQQLSQRLARFRALQQQAAESRSTAAGAQADSDQTNK